MTPLERLAGPVFQEGLGLSSQKTLDPSSLHAKLDTLLQAFNDQARREGHPARAVEESTFALAAWLDEIVFTTTEISLEWLGHSLAAHRFQDPAAGSTFFDRIAALQLRPELSGALDLYARCIVLGFQGKHRLDSPEVLQQLVKDLLSRDANHPSRNAPWVPSLDAPAGHRPKERTGRALWWISLGLLALGCGIYFFLAMLTGN
ncbi:MAG: DotU family type IV/VI secretion system protein [Fibrobacteria bacterium]|nr:DotU family type IV/VI secretion system protein [Fibrobacteria bacterium]